MARARTVAAEALIGRERELAELEAMLARRGARVVLSGPRGMGKSALLRVIAERRSAHAVVVESDEPWHLERASLEQRVRAALRVEPSARDLGRALEVALRARRVSLLVLDDVASVDAESAARLFEAWALRAEGLLVASREPLVVAGAQLVLLGPLAEEDGCALLRERRAHLGLGGGASDAADLALVRRLDGMPLALELAAARAPFVSSSARSGDYAADDPATLGGLVDALLAQLDPTLRAALEALAVIPGSFDAELASAAMRCAPAEAIERLRALRLRGLVLPVPTAEPCAPRFRALRLVQERLARGALVDAVPAWSAALVARVERLGITGPRDADEAATLAADAPLLDALGRFARAPFGASVAVARDHHLRREASFFARESALDAFVRAGGDAADPRVRTARAEVALGGGHVELARSLLADVDATQLPAVVGAWLALRRGLANLRAREPDAAERDLGLALLLAVGTDVEAHVLGEVGYLNVHLGSPSALARARIERAVAIASEPDAHGRLDEAALARARTLQALLLTHVGDVDGGLRAARDALVRTGALGDRRDRALAALAEAVCLAELGHADQSDASFARAIAEAESRGALRAAAEYAAHAGAHRLARADVPGALALLSRALPELEAAGDLRTQLLFEPFLVLARRLHGDTCDDARADTESAHREPAERAARALAAALGVAWPLGREHVTAALDAFLRGEPAARTPVVHGAELRLALRLGRMLLRATPDTPVLVLDAVGRRFRVGYGPEVDLRKQPVLYRLLAVLTQSARDAPSVAVSIASLLCAGWPDERTVARSGAQRVHTAIRRLRRAGLGPVLKSSRDGYWLDARVEPVASAARPA